MSCDCSSRKDNSRELLRFNGKRLEKYNNPGNFRNSRALIGREWRHIPLYYMEKSVLLGTKPLVDSIRHFIRDPSGVFSVCHLCECRIVQ